MDPVVIMEGISKIFPGVVANDRIDLEIRKGEVHAILGENGAGKTTLMNVLYGLFAPDQGNIFFHDKKVSFHSPRDAIRAGIGMVHQHFTLVPSLTVLENISLGIRSRREPFLDEDGVRSKLAELAHRYNLDLYPNAKVWQLSLGAQQKVEIANALYRSAEVLILDEPTSVLTPQETFELFHTLRSLVAEGHSVIFISHKLDEVMSISDRITVLRDGKKIITLEKEETDKHQLARMMVGREVLLQIAKEPAAVGEVALELKEVRALNNKRLLALDRVSFALREGEILGIAGVEGNGQSELAEVILGLRRATHGQVIILGKEATNRSPREIIRAGVGYIPEDRHRHGLVMEFDLSENIILESYYLPPFSSAGFLNRRVAEETAERLVKDYDVRPANKAVQAKYLSGGNQQKLILARQLSRQPRLLIAVYPTRGLDIGATQYVYNCLLEQRKKGMAILLISNDLEEILSLSDRVAVMYGGRITGVVPAEAADMGKIGLMMAGAVIEE